MAELSHYLSILFKFLAASLVIERILEYLDRIFLLIGWTRGSQKSLLRLTDKALSKEQENRRIIVKMLVMQSIGLVTGVLVAWKSQLGVARELQLVQGGTLLWWDVMLTGLLISGGAEPIHNLINFIKGKKDQVRTEREKLEDTHKERLYDRALAALDIDYDGGIDPKQAGHALRKQNPRYIVIHHSGTHENMKLDELIRHIQETNDEQSKRFYQHPAFHTVITKDGAYHHYGRWDSLGAHMLKGKSVSNGNSLALCFMGNYENRSRVQGYNDWDTNPKPTEAQIETGAKMIALWRLLYNIKEKNVLPHRTLNRGQTSCPGNNFPLERLVARSGQLAESWRRDEQIMKAIERFKQKKYIYV